MAATVESTPPESPNITLSDFSLDFKYETVWSINESGVQSCFNFEIFPYYWNIALTSKYFNIIEILL